MAAITTTGVKIRYQLADKKIYERHWSGFKPTNYSDVTTSKSFVKDYSKIVDAAPIDFDFIETTKADILD